MIDNISEMVQRRDTVTIEKTNMKS